MERFDELKFFAEIKKRPGMFLGSKSINLLVAYINGIGHHAYVNNPYISPVLIYDNFNDWYMKKHKIEDKNGYVIWWNHILYVCANSDYHAFDRFISEFEEYIAEIYNVKLPEVK